MTFLVHLPRLRSLATMLAAPLLVLGALSGSALASDAASRFDSPEVTLRLVAKEPDADGNIRAALLVDLAPGWKTYWIDPGEAGLPPRIDLASSTNLSVAAVEFPPPLRFGDEYATSNGYSAPMAVALTLKRKDRSEPDAIDATVTLGVCETVCVPISARLSLPEAASPPQDAALVDAAFAALAQHGSPTDRVTSAALSADGKTLVVTATLAAAETAPVPDLFVAGPRGWSFGKPLRAERRGAEATFVVPVFAKPRKPGSEPLLIDAIASYEGAAFETRQVPVTRPDASASTP